VTVLGQEFLSPEGLIGVGRFRTHKELNVSPVASFAIVIIRGLTADANDTLTILEVDVLLENIIKVGAPVVSSLNAIVDTSVPELLVTFVINRNSSDHFIAIGLVPDLDAPDRVIGPLHHAHTGRDHIATQGRCGT